MHAISRRRLGNGLLDQLTAPAFLAAGLVGMIIVMPLAAEPGGHSSAAWAATNTATEPAKATARTQPSGEVAP